MEEVCFHDMVQSSAWQDVYFRLRVIRDLIDITVVEESKGQFFGSFDPSNLYFLGKKVHIRQIPDISSPNFQNLRKERRIRTYREELMRVVCIIVPQNSNMFGILDRREYRHFQRLLCLDLTLYELRQLFYHPLLLTPEERVIFVCTSYVCMRNRSNDTWRVYSERNAIGNFSMSKAINGKIGFVAIYENKEGNRFYKDECVSILNYWRNIAYHLNVTLFEIAKGFTEEEKLGQKFFYTPRELGVTLTGMFPDLVVELWIHLFENNFEIDFQVQSEETWESGSTDGK